MCWKLEIPYGLGLAQPKVKLKLKMLLTSIGSKLFVYKVKSRWAEVHMESRTSYFSLDLYYQVWKNFPVSCLAEIPCAVMPSD